MFTLAHVANHPESLTFHVPGDEGLVLRPLVTDDELMLVKFFEGLGSTTKKYFSLSSDSDREARERCAAIARYDKLRLIASVGQELIGLIEFSLSLVDDDHSRFKRWGIRLNPLQTIRFGPCVADEYKGTGVARRIMPFVEAVALRFGRTRMILWGGVYCENTRAIKFYEKVGFLRAGTFVNSSGILCLDMYKDLDAALLISMYGELL